MSGENQGKRETIEGRRKEEMMTKRTDEHLCDPLPCYESINEDVGRSAGTRRACDVSKRAREREMKRGTDFSSETAVFFLI